MHSAIWALFLISIVMLPPYSLTAPFSDIESEMDKDKDIAQKIKERLDKLKFDLTSYQVIIDEVLEPKYEAIHLQNKINAFTLSVNDQMNTVSDLKQHLALHETSMNASLSRQEEQLSKLEPQFLHLEIQLRNQSSELAQLKQLWNDLGNKSVARAAEVTSLDHSIKGLEERLSQQEAKVEEQELATTTLGSSVESAEGTLKQVEDELQEALNAQGRLEGVLVTVQKELAELRASGGGGPAAVVAAPQTEADSLCKRLAGS